MSIQDVTSRVLDVDIRDIAVRELKGDVVLGTPEVLRARNAREFRTLSAADSAVPVASREFSRTERLLIRFPAYAPAGTQPTVSARFAEPHRTADARPHGRVRLRRRGRTRHRSAARRPGRGDYFVEVEAAIPSGETRDRVGFRVTP